MNEHAIEMLHSYRKHCAASSSPGQLILPESLKLLPVYLSALYKTPMFAVNRASGGGAGAGGRGGGADPLLVRADARVASMLTLNSLPASRLVPFIYPRLFTLHNLGGWVRVLRAHAPGATSKSAPRASTRPPSLPFSPRCVFIPFLFCFAPPAARPVAGL